MYNVSAEYLEKINSLSKQVDWFGKVTLTNGTQILFDSSDLSQGQTTITRQLCDSSSIKIGCACSSELKIAFMLDYDEENNLYYFNGIEVNKYDFYDATIDLTFRLFFDDERYEDIPFCTFIAADVERSRMILTCTAYDYMTKFMESCVSTIQGSPYNVLLNACSVCGVELGNTPSDIRNMVNGTSTLVEYDPNNLIQTWRDVVGFVAGFLCGNAVIKNDNKLYIIPYDGGEYREISADNRKSLTIADFISNYQTITATYLRTNTEIKATKGDGMTYKMGSNPLMQYVTPLVTVGLLSNILDILSEMPYVPFNGQFFADPSFELGDRVNFTENHAGDSTLSIVTKIVLKINGAMEMSCEGDDPYKQKAEDAANKEKASETSGSVGDGVTFYDDTVLEDMTIENGDSEVVFTIPYNSNGDYRQELAAQIHMWVDTYEELENNAYTIDDCIVSVMFLINGQEVTYYHPSYCYTNDGEYLLDLFFVWLSDIRIEQSTLEVVLTVRGGEVSIGGLGAYARIMQSGTAYVAPSNELEYIEAEEGTYKVVYKPGETIDFSSIVVWAYYEDGHKEDVASQCTFTPSHGTPITDEKAAFTVDIVYVKNNKEYKTNITLEVDYLIAISVDKEPTKDEYFVGETLDLSGTKIMASYSVSKDKDKTSSCTFNPSDGTVITQQMLSGNVLKVNVSYTENGVTKACEMPLTVMPVALEEIKIDTPPTKTTYKVGENIDLTGIVVNAYYSDGTITNVTQNCTYEPGNGSAVTAQTAIIKATYQGKVDTCDLTVITFDGIAVTTLPNKTKYWYGSGEVMDYTGMVVTGTWSDGTTEDVTAECTVSPASGSAVTLDTSSVTVSYVKDGTTYTDTFNVECNEAEPVIKYIIYSVSGQTIIVEGLDVEAIAEDQIQNLNIPATYTDPESGIVFTLRLMRMSN